MQRRELRTPFANILESAYMKELDRRSIIEWGTLLDREFLGGAAAP